MRRFLMVAMLLSVMVASAYGNGRSGNVNKKPMVSVKIKKMKKMKFKRMRCKECVVFAQSCSKPKRK